MKDYITLDDIVVTDDGFAMLNKSLADILMDSGIKEIDGVKVESMYDDWYLYGIQTDDRKFTYSLLKMREQEYDANIGDGDDPSVGISFVSVDPSKLFKDAKSFSKYSGYVINPGKHDKKHDKALTAYFSKTESKAGYLIANLYIDKVVSESERGIVVNENMISLESKIADLEKKLREIEGDSSIYALSRVPRALNNINEQAGYQIYDPKTGKITIKDPSKPTEYERQAVLAITTSNVNQNSFVAEVQFHAQACDDWKAIIPKWYDAAIVADMGLGEEGESGYTDKYYDLNSEIVKAQEKAHGKK